MQRLLFTFRQLLLHLAVIASLIAVLHGAELWCIENDESAEIISNFTCRTDTNEKIVQQCYNSSHRRCIHQFFKYPIDNIQEFFDDDDYFHIKVAAAQPWNDNLCYGSDTIFFKLDQAKQKFIMNYLLDIHKTHSFWLPARADNYNSARWGGDFSFAGEESLFKCISVNFTGDLRPVILLRSCSDVLPMILCVSHRNPLIQASCEVDSVALRIRPTQCYRVMRNNSLIPVINQNYTILLENHAAEYLASYLKLKNNETCLVNYNSSLNTSIVLNSTAALATVKGIPETTSCSMEMYTIFPKDGDIKMFREFETTFESIIPAVCNRRNISCDRSKPGDGRDDLEDSDCGISCFTCDNHGRIVALEINQYVREDDNKTLFALKLYDDRDIPTRYWCDAHSISNFELVETPEIVDPKRRYSGFYFYIPKWLSDWDKIVSLEYYELHIKSLPNVMMSIKSFPPHIRLNVLCHAAEYFEDVSDQAELDVHVRPPELLSEMIANSGNGSTNTVNSTRYCFSEPSPTINRTWQPTELGTSATTFEFCLLDNELPVHRKCVGDWLYGATWESLDPTVKCVTQFNKTIITKILHGIDERKYVEKQPKEALTKVETLVIPSKTIIAADLFYLGRIMRSASAKIKTTVNPELVNNTEYRPEITSEDSIKTIIRIYNSLMERNSEIFKLAIKLNSTNVLLEAFEDIFNTISLKKDVYSNDSTYSDLPEKGVTVYNLTKLLVFIIDPAVSNYSGVAILNETKLKDECDHFHCNKVRYLFANESQTKLLNQDHLEIASFVPQSLIDRLNEIPSKLNQTLVLEKPPLRIVIKLYYNGKFFQEDRDVVENPVHGKIISVSIPGYGPSLPETLPLFMKTLKAADSMTGDECGYWNYSTWANDGLEFINKSKTDNDVVLFACSHLTPFAYLIHGSYNFSQSQKIHKEALDIITFLGCSLSLLGITGILITAIIFDKWREKPTSKLILNLSIAISFQMILFCFVNTKFQTTFHIANQIFSVCIILGACLHYSVLVEFSWMFIIAYLQYKRYVQVLGITRPPHFFSKALILGWCIPLVPVGTVLILCKESYIPISKLDESQICYPSGQALYFGIILPIALIIAANLIIFILVLLNIVRGPSETIRSADRSSTLSLLRLSFMLLFVLGITWIFGLLAAAKISLFFSYLFCLTATLLGFIMFLYFIVLDPVTRNMWSSFLKGLFCRTYRKYN